MALGAAGDAASPSGSARAIGLEARAMGVNVVYAPVCDLATNPANPALGIRSFGDDPAAVGRLGGGDRPRAAAAGVAAAVKHFPGLGERRRRHASRPARRRRRRASGSRPRELVPFRAAIAAGARLVDVGARRACPALDRADPTCRRRCRGPS